VKSINATKHAHDFNFLVLVLAKLNTQTKDYCALPLACFSQGQADCSLSNPHSESPHPLTIPASTHIHQLDLSQNFMSSPQSPTEESLSVISTDLRTLQYVTTPKLK